uniref:Uncharacterized protein n=1 Tax=viral metagenome TaxID=1070528 RepID=A0A6H1ZVH5_9ZZZZ
MISIKCAIWCLLWIIGGNIFYFLNFREIITDVYLFRESSVVPSIVVWFLAIWAIYCVVSILWQC